MKLPTVINAAGKLTALGGSAQSEAVAQAQANAAMVHVDLARLRALAGERVADLTGAEAACITSGAAAGIAISIAGTLTGTSLQRVQQLPETNSNNAVVLQAGHAVNFGASVAQMIRLGGGTPLIIGSTNSVPLKLLKEALANQPVAAMLYVKSHHCVQENMIPLADCIATCREANVPVIVDAAAEEDLGRYIEAGADLVTYSGGKAFGGPTVGFIAGRKPLIDACELQFQGIARTMKVGKEAIAGLLAALDQYVSHDDDERLKRLAELNDRLVVAVSNNTLFDVSCRPDEAGRPFSRVAIKARAGAFDIRSLVKFLFENSPSIRTRNHHLDQGFLLIDPRELTAGDVDVIAARLNAFNSGKARLS